jgi:hypothetical protein
MKSKYLHALSEILHFYDLENPGTFSAPNRALRDTGAESVKTHKTGTNWIPVLIADVNIVSNGGMVSELQTGRVLEGTVLV